MDDTVQIRCHRCKGAFRDKARRVRSGYSRQCPSCETVIFFDDGTIDKSIQRSLREARQVRKELRELEMIKVASTPAAAASASQGSHGTGGRSYSDEEIDS